MPNPTTCILRDPRAGTVSSPAGRSFGFDHAFWTLNAEAQFTGGIFADQTHVYKALGLPILDNAFNGYNSCLFAYGQTGSGKTYTMMGSPATNPGVIPQLCVDLFTRAEAAARQNESIVTVDCSYLEIYNENVRDLLSASNYDKQPLKVRQHPRRGVYVEGLTKTSVKTAEDVLKLLDGGGKLRAVAATNMNAQSSRSHAILTLVVKNHRVASTELVSQVNLVDLAGSERAASTGAEGNTLLEGSNINKSLTTLGMVLSKLAEQSESGGKGVFVPFRDSQLTWILNDSLGGNSRTAMLANISPASINYDETLSTLRFAMTVKKVKNNAVVNEDPQQKLIRELREEIDTIRQQMSSSQVTTDMSASLSLTASEGQLTMQRELQERISEMQHLEEEQSRNEELVRSLREKIKEMDELKQHLAVTVSEQQRQRFATAFRSAFLLSQEKLSSAGRKVEVAALSNENDALKLSIETLERQHEEIVLLHSNEKENAKAMVRTLEQQLSNERATREDEVNALRTENVRLGREVTSLQDQLRAARTIQRHDDPSRPLLASSTSEAKSGCPCSVM